MHTFMDGYHFISLDFLRFECLFGKPYSNSRERAWEIIERFHAIDDSCKDEVAGVLINEDGDWFFTTEHE